MENGSRAAELLVEARRSPAAGLPESSGGFDPEPSCARGRGSGPGDGGAGAVEMEPSDPLEPA